MTTKIPKGQATRPNADGEPAPVRVSDRTQTEGEAYMKRLKPISRRRPFRGFSTEESMRITRGED